VYEEFVVFERLLLCLCRCLLFRLDRDTRINFTLDYVTKVCYFLAVSAFPPCLPEEFLYFTVGAEYTIYNTQSSRLFPSFARRFLRLLGPLPLGLLSKSLGIFKISRPVFNLHKLALASVAMATLC
jgi:hypothetical protein